MVHLNPEQLAGVALDAADPLDRDDLRHLDECAVCRSELDDLRRTAETLRRAEPVPPLAPDRRVWDRIAGEVAAAGSSPVGRLPSAVLNPPRRPESRWDEPRRDEPRRVSPRRAEPRRRRAWVLAAAALGVVVGIGSTVVVDRLGSRTEVVSSTGLVALPGHTGSGTAELVRTGGVTELRVRVEGTPSDQEYRELWLINTDGKRMYAVGVLPPTGNGSYPIPAELAGGLAGFTIVDVSIEPYDGNAEHSHNSLVRGTLPA